MSERKYKVLSGIFKTLVATRNDQWYQAPDFPTEEELPLGDRLRWPRAIGDKCYGEDATAFRLTGADPVFPNPRPLDVPQKLIDAFRETFSEGLRTAFPDDKVKDYLQAYLAEECFDGYKGPIHDHYYAGIMRQFPRILKEPPQETSRRLGESLELDVNRSDEADQEGLLHTTRTDRHSLTNADLLRTYRTLQKHPELAIAIHMWQSAIEEYADALRYMLDDEYYEQIKDEIITGYLGEKNILDYFPIINTIHFVAQNIDVATIPLFYISSAVANAQGDKASMKADHDICPEDFREGTAKALKRGIFLRRFESDYGERQIVCPFGPFGLRWLNMQLDNGETAIEAFLNKINDEKGFNPALDTMLEAAKHSFTELLARSDQDEIKRLDALGCPKKKPATISCPYHQVGIRDLSPS